MGKLKDKIIATQDIKSEQVVVPEWDVTIEIRTMKAIDRAALLRNCIDKQGTVMAEKFQAGLIIASCFDAETNEQIFSNDDYELIMNKSARPIEQLSAIAMRLSGLSREAVNVAEKNS